MQRRKFMVSSAATAILPIAARPAANSPCLAIFSPFEPVAVMRADGSNRYYRILFSELRRLGHVEGENLTVERYGREQNLAGSAALVGEVIRNKPDVVYAIGPSAILFSGTTVPVVALTGNPLGQGIAQSLARPGGNITGVTVDAGPIHAKRIELLRELAPKTTKLGVVILREQWEIGASTNIPAACEANAILFVPALLDAPTSEAAYREAIAGARREGADALMVVDSPDAVVFQNAIIDTAASARLPAVYFLREFVDAGGLLAYSFDLAALNRQAARDIDAILRGAKPGDIPFFQNTNFNLYVNLTTAKALGLAVPPMILAGADAVIE